MPKGVCVRWSIQETERSRGEEGSDLCKVVLINKTASCLGFIHIWWSLETNTFITALEEFLPTLENVSSLTLLPMFGEANAMGIVFEEED